MILAFTGHRNKQARIEDLKHIFDIYPNAFILHGGAVGFDTQVNNIARELNRNIQVLPPDYSLFGKFAPLIRDKFIAAKADILIALYDGRHKGGTFYTISQAHKLGKQVILLHPL